MIRLLGYLVINPRLVESMIYNEKDGRGWSTLTIFMASGAIHNIEAHADDHTCKEKYNAIIAGASESRSVTAYPPPPNGPSSL
jgi:hypothetical protein